MNAIIQGVTIVPSYPHMTVDLKSVTLDSDVDISFKLVHGTAWVWANICIEMHQEQATKTSFAFEPYNDRDYTVYYDEPQTVGYASAFNWSDDVWCVQDMPIELTHAQAAALNEHLDNMAQDKAKELAE